MPEPLHVQTAPDPVLIPIKMRCDPSKAMSLEFSPLIGVGEIVARITFVIEDEEKVGLLCIDYARGFFWLECPGVGVASIAFEDIGHVLMHGVIGDTDCDGSAMHHD